MIKILLVGMFNRVFEEINDALQTAEFNVQISAPDMNSIRGIVKLNRPDVIVVSLNGLTNDAKVLHGLYDKVGSIPSICYGTDFEQRQYEILRLTNFFHLVTKEDNYNNLFALIRGLAKGENEQRETEPGDGAYFDHNNDGGAGSSMVNTKNAKLSHSATSASNHASSANVNHAQKKNEADAIADKRMKETDYHDKTIGGGGVIVGAPIATIAAPGQVKQSIHPSATVTASVNQSVATPAGQSTAAPAGQSTATPAGQSTATPADQNKAAPAKKTVLVVDDSKAQLMVMNRILSTKYEVHLASDALRAMKMIGKSKPDAILLDYEMPDINGKRTFEMIREMEDTQDIPVVFLTGERSEENVRAVMAMKPAGYLLKPASADTIFEILDRVIVP